MFFIQCGIYLLIATWVPVESILEALPEVFLGTGGEWAFISEEQGSKEQRWRETRKQRLLGNREHKKTIFDCFYFFFYFFFLGGGGWVGGGVGDQANLFHGHKGTGTPPTLLTPWRAQFLDNLTAE